MHDTKLAEALYSRGLRLIDVARGLGVTKGTVTRWALKRIPAERVLEIERFTDIPRCELRPDIYPPEAV
jgi:DNA-binding transcriptional regulator YdaS (Cro superfamily)